MHDRFIDAVNQLGGCESKISALWSHLSSSTVLLVFYCLSLSLNKCRC
jgi:hypothetical protein